MTNDSLRRVEQNRQDGQLWQKTPGNQIRPVAVPQLISAAVNATSHQNRVVISWVDVPDTQVLRYNIWIQSPSGYRVKMWSTEYSPAVFDIGTSAAGAAIAYIQTEMKNGMVLTLDRCPTVTFTLSL